MSTSVCLACSVRAVSSRTLEPSALLPHGADASSEGTQYTCSCCGDHRLTLRSFGAGHEERVHLHPSPGRPTLRQVERVMSLENGENAVERTYFIDDVPVERAYWDTRLSDRRRLRLAIVSN